MLSRVMIPERRSARPKNAPVPKEKMLAASRKAAFDKRAARAALGRVKLIRGPVTDTSGRTRPLYGPAGGTKVTDTSGRTRPLSSPPPHVELTPPPKPRVGPRLSVPTPKTPPKPKPKPKPITKPAAPPSGGFVPPVTTSPAPPRETGGGSFDIGSVVTIVLLAGVVILALIALRKMKR